MYPGEASFVFLSNLFVGLIGTNILLAVFNLIPIHPLDGEKILVGLLPDKESRQFDAFMNRFGTILLFILIFPLFGGNSLISPLMNPIINFFLKILVPGFFTIWLVDYSVLNWIDPVKEGVGLNFLIKLI